MGFNEVFSPIIKVTTLHFVLKAVTSEDMELLPMKKNARRTTWEEAI